MIYEASYNDYLESRFKHLEYSKPKKGSVVEDLILLDTDEDSLTERERFIFILVAIKYEVEHDMLTEWMKDELDYYFDLFERNAFEDELGEDEEEQVMHDLYECYKKVFGQD